MNKIGLIAKPRPDAKPLLEDLVKWLEARSLEPVLDIDTAAILARLLRRMGHDVLPASSVSAALALAKKEMRLAPIDIVMSDLGLPDGSGLDLMRRLSGDYGLRGIALRGFGMDSDLEQSTAAAFSRHLVKPIDISTLRATLLEMTSGA